MAHFAQLDENNIVTRVVVISNDDLLDSSGVEIEARGIATCWSIFGPNTRWVQTSINGRFRKQYAAIGMTYDVAANVFYSAVGPFPSWSLNSDFDWVPPVPMPSDGRYYIWNESNLAWEEAIVEGVS